ncbi:MAG: helix-turn-helix domain-containing protein [Planctomycetes bacterium]|nr:helix-turn-helix domain-containing protein [Planctomycetota bacterium]
MKAKDAPLCRAIESSLNVEYLEGALSGTDGPASTGWRALPVLLGVESRTGRFWLEIEGVEPIRVARGQGIVVPPGIRHRISSDAPYPSKGSWCHLQVSLLGALDPFAWIDVPPLADRSARMRLGPVLREMQDLQGGLPGSLLAVMARRKELGFQLFRIVLGFSRVRSHWQKALFGSERILAVLQFLQKNLGQALCREDLAKRAYLSEPWFHVVFKEATGLAPMEYLRRLRIREAQSLLLRTDLSIEEVGRKVGYSDPFHFSRAFKAASGQSPSGYRTRHRRWWVSKP